MTNTFHYYLRLLTILILFCTGCVQEKPVTHKEAMDFAKQLESSIAKRDPAIFNTIFDTKTLKDRVKAASDGKLGSNILSGIPAALEKRKFGNEIIRSIGKEGMYSLVKTYEKDGKQRVIFRVYGESGLNYHDMELIRAGKEIKAADIYLYVTGENISKSLADMFLQMEDYKTAEIERFSKSVAGLKKFIAQEKYNDALALFNTLSDTLKKQKLFQIFHVQIASKLDNDVYTKALDEYKKLFPGEPGMYLLLIDIHFLAKEYEKALDDVNQMDSAINKDPFLDYYRGLIYNAMEKDSVAQTYFERLNKNMPDFTDGMLELIYLYAEMEEKDKANALIKRYKSNKKFKQETLDMMYTLYPDLEK